MYQPRIVPPEPDDIPAFLAGELQRIAREMVAGRDYLQLNELHVAPSKPRDGMVVYADGADWEPVLLGGEGFYGYYAAAWHKLG